MTDVKLSPNLFKLITAPSLNINKINLPKINLPSHEEIASGIRKEALSKESVSNKEQLLSSEDGLLPVAIWLACCQWLDVKSVVYLSLSCKTYYNIIHADDGLLDLLRKQKREQGFFRPFDGCIVSELMQSSIALNPTLNFFNGSGVPDNKIPLVNTVFQPGDQGFVMRHN